MKQLAIATLFAGAIGFAAACGGGGTPSFPDAGIDGGAALDICDPVDQQGCAPGEKCASLREGPNLLRTACVPNGSVPPGGACMVDMTLGYDDCQAEEATQGYECNGACTEVCSTTPDSCGTDRVCQIFSGLFTDVPPGNTTGMCLPACDPVAQDCADANAACYYNAGAGKGICGGVAMGAEEAAQGDTCVGPRPDVCFLNGCAKGYGDWLPKLDGTAGQLCSFFCTPESVHDGNIAGASGPAAPAAGQRSCNSSVTPEAPGVGDALQCRNMATFYDFGPAAPAVPAELGFCVPKAEYGDCTAMPYDQCILDADATADSCKSVTTIIICNRTFGCLNQADFDAVRAFFPATEAELTAICNAAGVQPLNHTGTAGKAPKHIQDYLDRLQQGEVLGQ